MAVPNVARNADALLPFTGDLVGFLGLLPPSPLAVRTLKVGQLPAVDPPSAEFLFHCLVGAV